MPDYLLDANHASPLVTEAHPLRERVLRAMTAGCRFALAAPCLTEVLYGISVLPRGTANRRNWALLVPEFTIHSVDAADAEAAAELQIRLRRQGWQLATIDALVAAVTLRYHLTLLTTDEDFSRVPHLSAENWLTSNSAG